MSVVQTKSGAGTGTEFTTLLDAEVQAGNVAVIVAFARTASLAPDPQYANFGFRQVVVDNLAPLSSSTYYVMDYPGFGDSPALEFTLDSAEYSWIAFELDDIDATNLPEWITTDGDITNSIKVDLPNAAGDTRYPVGLWFMLNDPGNVAYNAPYVEIVAQTSPTIAQRSAIDPTPTDAPLFSPTCNWQTSTTAAGAALSYPQAVPPPPEPPPYPPPGEGSAFPLNGLAEFRTQISLSDLGPDGGQYNVDNYNEANYAGLVPYFQTVSSATISVDTSRGRDRFDTRVRAGTAGVIYDNQGGAFNPDTGQGAQALRPGRTWRVQGRRRKPDIGPWVTVMSGRIESMSDIYRDGALAVESRWVVLDALADLQIERLPDTFTQPAGSRTDERVRVVLEEVQSPLPRNLELGLSTMSALTGTPSSALEAMQQARDAEQGQLFATPTNTIEFRNRDWFDTNPRATTPQWKAGGQGDTIKVIGAGTEWSRARIYNDINAGRVGGTSPIRVGDSASVALYGTRTLERLNYEVDNDTDLQQIATWLLDRFSYDAKRLESVSLLPTTGADVDTLLGTELGDRITVTIQTAEFEYFDDYWVLGIKHRVTMHDWVCTLKLDAVPSEAGGGGLLRAYQTDAYRLQTRL